MRIQKKEYLLQLDKIYDEIVAKHSDYEIYDMTEDKRGATMKEHI
jgi:hypothetical protein